MTLHREKTAVRQHQIIDAARSLIISRGLESVTIDAIAEAVGLSEGAIYRHFTSKQQILNLVIQDMEEVLLVVLERAEVPGAPALENLQRVLNAHLGSAEERRAASFIVVSHAMAFEGVGLAPRVSSMMTKYLDRIRRILEQAVQEGTVRPDVDLDAAATVFFGLIQSTATLWALHEYKPMLAEHRAQMWDIYKQGLISSS